MTANAIITPAIGHSMGTQLKRVNNDPRYLRVKLMEVEGERDYWKKRALAAEGGGTDAKYISASDFARKYEVAVSTVTRQLHSGKLTGYQDVMGYWHIRADAVYIKGKRGKAK